MTNLVSIQNVREVSLQDYVIQRLKNEFDPYFQETSRTDQKKYCNELEVSSLEDLGGLNLYRRNSRVGRKKYVNNYLPDVSEIEKIQICKLISAVWKEKRELLK